MCQSTARRAAILILPVLIAWCCNSSPPSLGRWISRRQHVHQLHVGRLDTGMETAPACTSTRTLENWYSVSRMTVLRLTHLQRYWKTGTQSTARRFGLAVQRMVGQGPGVGPQPASWHATVSTSKCSLVPPVRLGSLGLHPGTGVHLVESLHGGGAVAAGQQGREPAETVTVPIL